MKTEGFCQWTTCFGFGPEPLARVQLTPAMHGGSPWGSDVRLTSPFAPIESLELLLGGNESDWSG